MHATCTDHWHVACVLTHPLQKPTVRVRLSVHYRVHSRQVLCIGGSLIPFGWSFLSIAKVPMTWNSGDVWTCEVRACVLQGQSSSDQVLGCTPGQQELPTNAMYTMYNISWHPFLCLTPSHTCMQVDLQAGQRIEYKYVILEEQVRLPVSGGALHCTCTLHPMPTALMAL